MHGSPGPNGRPDFLSGGGEMADRIAAYGWAGTAVGPIAGWPQSLRTTVGIMLRSPVPMVLLWGPEGVMIYNDAYTVFAGGRHPQLLGSPVLQGWPEVADFNAHVMQVGLAGGTLSYKDQELTLYRKGVPEPVWMNLDYSPVLEESGRPGGVLAIVVETTDRVLAERRIASETERQRRLFEQAPGFITVLHGPEHRFEVVNQAYRRLFGERDFVGRTAREVFPELEDQGFFERLDRVYTSGERFVAHHLPVRLRASPDVPFEERFLDFIYEPVRDETGQITGIFCEGHDVTEAYRAQAAVAASNARYTSVLDAMSEGFLVLDEDYRITGINAEGLRLDGRPAGELIGRTHWEVAPASVGTPVEAAYHRAMTERVPVELDHHYVDLATGHDLWLALRIYPVPGGVAAFYRDVSATKRAEEVMRRSEAEARRGAALLEQLIETAPDPIWTKDETGRFMLVNSAAARVIGRPRHELPGLLNRDLLPGEQALFCDAEDERILRAGETVDTEEVVPDRSRGEERTFLSTKVPLRAPHGPVIGLLGMARDITERKEVEARLRGSSERVQLALDAGAIVGTWVWDVPADRFTADERFARSFGLDAELCRSGLPLERVMASIHENDRSRVAAAVAEALARGGSYRCEYRVRQQDGVYRWIEANGRVELAENGTPLRFPGVLLDIEERRAAEAERDQATALLRTFFEAVPGVVYAKDREGRMLMANRGTTELIGKPPEEYLGRTDAEFLDDKVQAEIVMVNDRRIMESGEPQQVEENVRLSNGTPATWLSTKAPLRNEAGEVVGLIGTSIDISERKRIEAALRESEEKLRGLNETLEQRVSEATAELDRVWRNSRDLLAVMGFDGYLKAINPAWEATLGFDEATLLALPFWEQVHPDDHAAVGALVERLRKGEAIARFEDRLRHADGSWRWIAWSLVPEGEVFYASGRDVTAEKVAAIELEQVQEALRQSQKLESMGQLTGGVAHDFNNLLMPIIGGLDMLQRRVTDERSQRLIQGALQSAERAKTLVQRLLAFARRQPLQPTAVDLPQLVEGMADLVASTSGPRVKVVVDFNPELPPVKADPNQLEMAILNLAVNARDAMPDGGQLTIAARDEILGSRHRSKLPVGHYVRLSVSDTGIGMDEATLARAIEPFFSTKGIGKGTGLGLSMVHGLAAQLGGALTLRSKPAVGTSVELWLPIASTTAEPPERPADAERPAAAGTVLLVDDEEGVRASTADMLSDLGYAVVETDSGEEALALIEGGLVPNVVVTDHLMPGMTGVDLARRLKDKRPTLPVLIISGYAEDEGIAPDLPRLTKPFRQAELAACLSGLSRVSRTDSMS